jgi:tetratricopeptide (TPR) repeat protein
VSTLEHLYHNIIESARSGVPEGVRDARDLCSQLPPADAENTTIVSSALIETAVALEQHADLDGAADLYSRLAEDVLIVPSIRANATFRLGAILGHLGRTEASLAALEAACSQSDDLLVQRTALYHLASSLGSIREYEKAFNYLDRLLQLPGDEPSTLAAQLKLVHCRARAGLSIEEIPACPATFSPLEAAAWIEAAFTLECTRHEKLSDPMYERFMSAGPMQDTLHGQALWQLVLGTLHACPEDAPALVPRLLEYAGEGSLASMLHAKAIECLAYKPDVLIEEIERIWDTMPKSCNPDLAGALMLGAFGLEQRGHLAAARWAYERLVTVDGLPSHVATNAHFRLGVTLDAQGEWNKAVTHYVEASQRADRSDPIREEASWRVAQAMQLAEDYTGAAQIFNNLREDASLPDAKRAKAQLQYGMCLLRAGHTDSAVSEIVKCRASTIGEISLQADVVLAEIYEAARDSKRACECYQRVLHHPEAHPLERNAALTRLRSLGG